ncbi:predicted protein [Naegleria gruberi]|uniref:Predicted protein n=1 Tax=Naegleria gruberi TaxID=5762 RepID=D2VWK1_NAEGR|nr:uncharacterized protein NAEGRDRAFT_73408 [Naegleria gruberi]EFC38907.1 predicted protein [Naegleria gruberi]|eukprot:XP_002671651.1 predicted protein [Naegleria gruberi strain NEG-M]
MQSHQEHGESEEADYSILPMDVILEIYSFLTLKKKQFETLQSNANLLHILFGYKNWDSNRLIYFLYKHFHIKSKLEIDNYLINSIFKLATGIKIEQFQIRDENCLALEKNQQLKRFVYTGSQKHFNSNMCESLSHCKSLRFLKLNTVYDTSFKILFNTLPKLRFLYVSTGFQTQNLVDFNFDGIVYEDSELRQIVLSSIYGFSDEHQLCNLFKFPKLVILYLENQNITKESFKFAYLNCKELCFDKCYKLTDVGANALSKTNCPNLETLKLSACSIRSQGLKSLFHPNNAQLLNQLKYLEMSKNLMVGTALQNLKNFQFDNLETVDFNYCSNLSDVGVKTLVKSICKTVKILKLNQCGITFDGFSYILENCSKLHKLQLVSNAITFPNVGDDNYITIDPSRYENLKLIKLEDNKITNIDWLLEHLPKKLDFLNLSANPIGNQEAKRIIAHPCEITYLTLEKCNLTDEFILETKLSQEQIPCLQAFRVIGNDFTDDAIQKLIEQQPQLTRLFLSGNARLTNKTIDTIVNSKLELQVLWLEKCPLISKEKQKECSAKYDIVRF